MTPVQLTKILVERRWINEMEIDPFLAFLVKQRPVPDSFATSIPFVRAWLAAQIGAIKMPGGPRTSRVQTPKDGGRVPSDEDERWVRRTRRRR